VAGEPVSTEDDQRATAEVRREVDAANNLLGNGCDNAVKLLARLFDVRSSMEKAALYGDTVDPVVVDCANTVCVDLKTRADKLRGG
jgi:hypothetical protein